ncbi:MAG: bifunctional diaminohydroxyphosphoribosylaminopyrimidine deaminase/5-amino-6-(5-phosphoribosylamino)uracil reductase RibD [Gammaproteobacteria bacterium]|nr:bifunctional diaminohydroxyphosphoribosylaminopyrimidine deaminase/5-amino-6-(5-phosphoribosylamino)uracil reductase RibD [Gammaproteobacteria bacterium]
MTKYMRLALKLAKKGESNVSPNPLVGCVIEKNNHIIGIGWHKEFGSNHAEIEALHQANKNTTNSNVYVNLEPCSHFGKTPPCIDALIKAKVRSVHIPFIDPNPLANGKGIEKLKKAGIKVYIGDQFEKAKQLNEIFLHYIVRKTPFVIAKWAMTLDGKIATRNFDSKWITEVKARRNYHKLRSKVDAILVGVGTVITDNSILSPYLIPEHKGKKTPLKIILDPCGNTPLTCNVLKLSPENTLIITTSDSHLEWRKKVKIIGASIWTFRLVKKDEINLNALLQRLGKIQISSLLVEGGAKTLGAFFKANLVNKVYTYIAPKLSCDKQALIPISGCKNTKIIDTLSLDFDQVQTIGNDLLVISYPKEKL